jgi:hypothetical protein
LANNEPVHDVFSYGCRFSVDSQSGDIKVAAPLTAFANQIVAFNCTATDGGGLATNVPVFITIVPFVPEGIQFSQASYIGSLNETSTTFNVGVTVMVSWLQPLIELVSCTS